MPLSIANFFSSEAYRIDKIYPVREKACAMRLRSVSKFVICGSTHSFFVSVVEFDEFMRFENKEIKSEVS
jgi:hypothetical protein